MDADGRWGFEYPVEFVMPYLTDFGLRRADAQESLRQQDGLIAFLRSAGAA